MNRRERRNLKKEVNIFSDVISILKQYFPTLTTMFEKLTDIRYQSCLFAYKFAKYRKVWYNNGCNNNFIIACEDKFFGGNSPPSNKRRRIYED